MKANRKKIGSKGLSKTGAEKQKQKNAHIVLILVALPLLLIIAVGVSSFIFSNDLLVPMHQDDFTLDVINVNAHSVTLPRTHDTEQHGIFGISWAGGQAAIVGDITSENQDTVTRQLEGRISPRGISQ